MDTTIDKYLGLVLDMASKQIVIENFLDKMNELKDSFDFDISNIHRLASVDQ
jgi:hypothetical protein